MAVPPGQPRALRLPRARAWLVAAILLLVTVGFLIFTLSSEPVYQGQRLSVWLENYYKDPGTGDYEQANNAVRAIGSNAIPVLLKMIAIDDSGFQQRVKKWLAKVPFLRLKWARPETLRIRAVHAFRALGEQGRPAVPRLHTLLLDPATTEYAAKCLAVIGDETAPILCAAFTNKHDKIRIAAADATRLMSDSGKMTVVPHLLPFLSDPSTDVRSTAAWSLGSNRKQPEVVVPALMRLFLDSNTTVQCNAIAGVGEFETEAVSAIAALENLANHVEADVRRYALSALNRIRRNR